MRKKLHEFNEHDVLVTEFDSRGGKFGDLARCHDIDGCSKLHADETPGRFNVPFLSVRGARTF